MPRIGIEGTLADVKGELQERGYELVDLRQEEDARNCDCCVISGQDKDVMGMADTITNGSVINANGLTAEQVCDAVDSKFR